MPPNRDTPKPDTLTPQALALAVKACLAARQSVCIHGPVGIGKSSIVKQTVDSIQATMQVEPASRRDPVDYSGVPVPNLGTRVTEWMQPAFLTSATDHASAHPDLPHVVFWDEFNRAMPAVQNVALNFILDGTSGEFTLPQNVCHVLAVNDAQDSTHVTQMSEAARNRVVHLYATADTPSWLAWAKRDSDSARTAEPFQFLPAYPTIATGRIRPECIAYLDNHPDHLHQFDRHADAFPTPRSWEFVSRILNPNLPPDVERALITGAIGMAVGGQFYAHLCLYRTLAGKFNIPRIIQNPTTEPLPQDVSSRYAVASALSLRMDPTNAQNIVTYLQRMPGEHQAFAILSAVRRTAVNGDDEQSPLNQVGAINRWRVANQDMF